MEELSIFERLVNTEEREKAAIRGTLRCSCGNEYFRIYFFGKRTRGILAPDITRQKDKINIQAYCEICEKSYGFDNKSQSQIQFNDLSKVTSDLVLYDKEKHKVRLSFNYFPEKFKSENFEYLRVEIFQSSKNKWRVIAEE
ncbi:MAG: hypothetical protein WC278_05765 [Bacilli bacterium]|jgi:hypothetical protein|nr:hypothetical protein [Acholeplasmataceae bacterium]MDY0364162.1 hypothetical protein [Bacilli bacterium]